MVRDSISGFGVALGVEVSVRDGTWLLVEVATSLDSSFVEVTSVVTEIESSVALNTVGTKATAGDSSTELNC